MSFPFVTGSLYNVTYTQWHMNPRVYMFCLYYNAGNPKVHALNLGAIQLTTFDRMKITRVIVKLSRVANASKYTGRLLYRIFKTYLPNEMKKCYRTYWSHLITQAALINYGLNKKEDLEEFEKAVINKTLFTLANQDVFIKAFNLATKGKVNLDNLQNAFAKTNVKTQADISTDKTTIVPVQPVAPGAVEAETTTPETPVVTPEVKPTTGTKPGTKSSTVKPKTPPPEDDTGYF